MSNQEEITNDLWESKNNIVRACEDVTCNDFHYDYKSKYEWLIRVAKSEADKMEKLIKKFVPPTEEEY